jgi:hypothetical protein
MFGNRSVGVRTTAFAAPHVEQVVSLDQLARRAHRRWDSGRAQHAPDLSCAEPTTVDQVAISLCRGMRHDAQVYARRQLFRLLSFEPWARRFIDA